MNKFEMKWGKRTYSKLCPQNLLEELDACKSYIPPVLNTAVRGKEITLQIDGMFMVWVAVFMDEIEPEQLDWIDSMPKGSVFYDIGASIGAFTTYAAISGMKCFAFEPEAQNFSALELHHFLNKERIEYPISSFNLALSDHQGRDYIYCENYEKGSHRKILGHSDFLINHKQSITVDSLDNIVETFFLPDPDYIKIDVDGAELEIIHGSNNILSSNNVKEIFIELPENNEGKSVKSAIESYGFVEKLRKNVESYDGLHNVIFSKITK